MSLYERIVQLLQSSGTWYEVLEHEPVYTSQQAAAVRPDISLQQGAKAMVLKAKEVSVERLEASGKKETSPSSLASSPYFMVVVPGDRRIDYKKVSRYLGVLDVILASPEEVEAVVGVKVGAVSPLGNLSSLKVLVDHDLLENDKIAFNAGDHSKTVKMKSSDYLRLSEGEVGDFSKPV